MEAKPRGRRRGFGKPRSRAAETAAGIRTPEQLAWYLSKHEPRAREGILRELRPHLKLRTQMKPTTAELAAALITVFEGPERLSAFRDSGGVWTIGRGHIKGVKPGDVITQEQSAAFFAADQAPLLRMVDNQPLLAAAAYVSFGYNCGGTNLALVLTGMDIIGNPRHTTDRHGNVQPGLVSRRRLEQLLINAA